MKRSLIRYKTKPERAEENKRLIERVFEELRAKSPGGLRYLALDLGDGSFVHFIESETEEHGGRIGELDAFQSFQSGIRERCAEPPHSASAAVVGNYRMLSE